MQPLPRLSDQLCHEIITSPVVHLEQLHHAGFLCTTSAFRYGSTASLSSSGQQQAPPELGAADDRRWSSRSGSQEDTPDTPHQQPLLQPLRQTLQPQQRQQPPQLPQPQLPPSQPTPPGLVEPLALRSQTKRPASPPAHRHPIRTQLGKRSQTIAAGCTSTCFGYMRKLRGVRPPE